MQDSIDYDRLDEALARIGYADAAAEYHGTLCGSLSVKAPAEINLQQLINSGDRPPTHNDAKVLATLNELRQQTLASLQDSDMAFQPLLPDDDTALVPRVRALVGWCEGFLYGLASKPGLDLSRCSEELREIVQDFTEFTRAAMGDEDPDIEETAYTELFEYVRVGAQLIFMELHPRPTLDPSQSKQLH